MSSLQFSQVSLNALAQVTHEGKHLFRTLSFADGHTLELGCLLPASEEAAAYELSAGTASAERIEITQVECEVRLEHEEQGSYYREGQSFVVAPNTRFFIKNQSLVQYVRRFEG